MKKPSDESGLTFEDLIGLGGHSARKSYYPELLNKVEELEAERNRYKWLFENALHGIFQAELDGSLTRSNRALARICGYSDPVQMEHKVNLADDLLFDPQELDRICQQLTQTGQLFLYETRLRRTDGSPVEVSMNILLRQESDGAIIEAFVADITERKRVQQRMRTLNEELEQRVGERTRELVSLNDRLWHEVSIRQQAEHEMQLAKEAAEAANLSKDKYLAAASHDLLQPLNELREATLAFGDYRKEWPLVTDMGLYQGHKVGPEVDAAYLDMLAYQYLPALMFGVMEEMGRAPDNSTERLEHLRVLRMLYDESGRRSDIVSAYMREYWQARFPGQREVQNSLYGHLQYAMAHTNLAGMAAEGDPAATMALAPFRSSVQWAQHELGRISTPDRVYRDLEVEANQEFQSPLELARSSGPAFSTVFTRVDVYGEPLGGELPTAEDPLSIPALLTREGLEKWFLRKSGSVTELALVDAWVLGRRNDVDFSKADEAELLASLQTLYTENYANTWRTALSRVDVHRFEDLNHGVRILESLTSGHQPLARLLGQVQDNTRLIPVGEGEAEIARKLLEESPHYRMLQEIERQFSDLNQLTQKQGDQPSGLDEIMVVVTELHEYMRNIQESPDAGKAALGAARARMGLQGADPIFTLQRMAGHQPEPLNRILNRLATESWRVVLDQAVAQLEREWYREVYQPFQQNLARHYPFTSEAGRDAALQDFERFFAPDGTLESFYNNNLKLFLEDHPEQVGDARRASLVRRDVLAALNQARQIRQAFFTRSGTLDVEFALEPLNLSNNKRRAVVNIDGQLVEFSHGPRQSIPLVWPNTLRDSVESRITLVPIQVNRSPRSVSESGPWALFRLLDKADIAGVSSNAVDVKFTVDDGEMRYRLHAASNTNPFTQQLLAGYRIPRSLY